jgi:hypothetical protein
MILAPEEWRVLLSMVKRLHRRVQADEGAAMRLAVVQARAEGHLRAEIECRRRAEAGEKKLIQWVQNHGECLYMRKVPSWRPRRDGSGTSFVSYTQECPVISPYELVTLLADEVKARRRWGFWRRFWFLFTGK